MLEVVIPGMRYGEAKINSSTAYNGCMCYIAGVDSENYQLLQVPYTTATAKRAIYPINKYYFEEDLNDTSDSVDKLTKGDTIVYYGGGEYITDKWVPSSFGLDATYWAALEGVSTVNGRKAYVPGATTALATLGMKKIYVSTGAASGLGYLLGSTCNGMGADGGLCTSGPSAGYVGFAIGVFFKDSSQPFLRFRIKPVNQEIY